MHEWVFLAKQHYDKEEEEGLIAHFIFASLPCGSGRRREAFSLKVRFVSLRHVDSYRL